MSWLAEVSASLVSVKIDKSNICFFNNTKSVCMIA